MSANRRKTFPSALQRLNPDSRQAVRVAMSAPLGIVQDYVTKPVVTVVIKSPLYLRILSS